MGRIKTQMIKRLSFQLLRDHKSVMKESFDENKVLVEQHMGGVASKKIRNTVAGYVTRLMKRREES
ncbi:30S ribosomal protein S17e [Candidatus Woesearchaeota archaeon]|nr:30S ribosomal protein S17e [Candidatus Woesearchaeota archaeon]